MLTARAMKNLLKADLAQVDKLILSPHSLIAIVVWLNKLMKTMRLNGLIGNFSLN